MRLSDINGDVCLLGFGIDIAALIPHIGQPCPIYSDHPIVDNLDFLSRFNISILEELKPHKTWIRSPGFPKYRSDVAQIVGKSNMTTPMDLWIGENEHRQVIAVTGTKGKSTVANMIAELTGYQLGGNIGEPVWTLEDKSEPVILEVSSYQSADINHSVDLGVLVSLGEDHVSWHGSVAKYHEDKLKIIKNANHAVGGRNQCKVKPAATSVGTRLAEWLAKQPLHTQDNITLALAVTRMYKEVSDEEVIEILEAMEPLKARLTVIRNDKVKWVDDALASNPMGTAAAVDSFTGPLELIIGGEDRQVDWKVLWEALNRYRGSVTLWAIPSNGVDLSSKLSTAKSVFKIEEAASVQDAVNRMKPLSGTVLFSPAAPTPGLETWVDRSYQFNCAVLNHK